MNNITVDNGRWFESIYESAMHFYCKSFLTTVSFSFLESIAYMFDLEMSEYMSPQDWQNYMTQWENVMHLLDSHWYFSLKIFPDSWQQYLSPFQNQY